MKTILLCVGLLTAIGVSAQTTRKIVDNKELNTREKYYVLKTDKQIKQGLYQQSNLFSTRLTCEGYYKNNLKDSLWTFYAFDGKVVETGLYKDGKKTGNWKCYNPDGTMNVEYDFTNGKLLNFHPPKRDTGKYLVINGKDTIQTYLDRPPVYLDGDGRLSVAMVTGMRYPREAREYGTQGTLIVAFTINQQGVISGYRIKKSLGHGCDEEGIKAIKRVDGDWLPGMLNGKPVAVEYEMPLSFALSN